MAEKEQGTEAIIKEAARKIFQQKGFAATRTREIAEAADINLALLNYYFRSKKKLYDIIMIEAIQAFFSQIQPIINNETTDLRGKIADFVTVYIDILSENPNIASFIMNEVRENPKGFAKKVGFFDNIMSSAFFRQFMEAAQKGEIPPIHPLHFLMNLTSLIVFPFIAMPMLSVITGNPQGNILKIIEERKRLIPLWIDEMLSVK
jgi:AcrR family transcriptional regulator